MHMQVSAHAAVKIGPASTIGSTSPTSLEKPAFILGAPFSYATEVANNAWMRDLAPHERQVNQKKAMRQFLELYHFLSSEALVYLLPAPGDCGLQDLVFTANLGVVPPHLTGRDTAILSNFASEPRRGETRVGELFFKSLGYDVCVPPHHFEGEAELKHLYENVYIGGYGIRSERAVYEWMEANFDMTVIKVEEVDEYLYHLDTTVFPLTAEKTLVCTEMYEPAEIAEIEKHTEIIDVSADHCYSGVCNSVRLCNAVLNASHVHDLKAGTEDYRNEVAKNRRLEDIAVEHGFEVNFFNLSEFLKGGALLSCMVLHLNRNSYSFQLL